MLSISNNILFVLEGENTEDQIIANLQKVFFVPENTIITCAYGGEIYQIYDAMSKDNDLDTFNLIKERKQNIDTLKSYKRDDFAEIYLFFDYDGHSNKADDGKLKRLLNFFDEETDKGKLYISYPMVEALKHISCYDSFKNLSVKCKEKVGYKKIVSTECLAEFQNFRKYSKEIWLKIITIHLKKMHHIMCDLYKLPGKLFSQVEIFSKQKEKFIDKKVPEVAVLSAFPVFLHDYYGNEKIIEAIKG